LALVSGVSRRAVAKRFGISPDAAWRHLRRHVDQHRRAQLVAGPLTLQQLAEKANAEGMTLLDYLAMIRSALMQRFLAASESDDRPGTALLAGRLTEVLRLVAQVTGELSRATSTVNNNTLIMASPLMADLQQMLMTRLRGYPDAAREVVAGLEELSARALQGSTAPMLGAPRV
jgi:transposase-like protein